MLATTCAPLSQARYAFKRRGGGRLNIMRGQVSQPAIGRDLMTRTRHAGRLGRTIPMKNTAASGAKRGIKRSRQRTTTVPRSTSSNDVAHPMKSSRAFGAGSPNWTIAMQTDCSSATIAVNRTPDPPKGS